MFLSLYHHEIVRNYYHWQKWCPCQRSRSEVKVTEVKTKFVPILGVSRLQLQFDFTDGYEMTHKAWSSIEEVPYYYTPRFNEVERGVYWYHLDRLSVCGQNRVRSVSSTILIGSISYLHILSSNFRRCVACNARFKIQKFEILANFLNL